MSSQSAVRPSATQLSQLLTLNGSAPGYALSLELFSTHRLDVLCIPHHDHYQPYKGSNEGLRMEPSRADLRKFRQFHGLGVSYELQPSNAISWKEDHSDISAFALLELGLENLHQT